MGYRRSAAVWRAAAAVGAALISSPAFAQLRIVTMNGANGTPDRAQPRNGDPAMGQRLWMKEVLTAIGSTVSDDPTVPGNSGIAKPIDILALQEVNSASTTGAGYANLLNSIYPGANYQYVNRNGATTGSGTQALVYNANTVTVLDSAVLGSTTVAPIQARQTLRYHVQPVGYTNGLADFYIYNSHYKASDAAADRTERNNEATVIRNDTDNNANISTSNILYVGDFNSYKLSTESMMTTLTAAGKGQAFDPINQMGQWSANSAYKAVHTQSPFNSTTAGALGTGFSGTGGGMDDRFDWQMSTANVQDGHGFAIIPNSYSAFGNNNTADWGSGTSAGDLAINDPSNMFPGTTPAERNGDLLDDMAAILDHLPVVADYQLPAKQSVSVASVPSRVITGGSVQLGVTVSNSAPVSFANGADVLAYTVTASGAISGSTSGTDAALGSGNTHNLTLSTAGTGAKSGAIAVNSSSEAVADGAFSQNVNYTVVDHAQPRFANAAPATAMTTDFGYVPAGFAPRTSGFSVFNRPASSGASLTAGMDVDGVTTTGDGAITTNVVASDPAAPLAANAGTWNYTATFTPGAIGGDHTAVHSINVSDENIPGAAVLPSLTLTTKGYTLAQATFPATGFIQLLAGETYDTGLFAIAGGVTLTKNGPGTMNITAAQSNGAGSQLAVSAGSVNINTDSGSAANPNLTLTASGSANVTINSTQHLAAINAVATTITVATGGDKLISSPLPNLANAKLDLTDNKMIVRGGTASTWSGSHYLGAAGLVQTGRNGGTWNGLGGIITTMTDASGSNALTTLAVAAASDVLGIDMSATGTWSGETVSGSDTLVKYTYAGDANLSGRINADDYFQIDSNYASSAPTYFKGDFNYDGQINGDDYFLIDSNFAVQTVTFNAPPLADGVSAVPEPTAGLLLMVAAGAMARRRRAGR